MSTTLQFVCEQMGGHVPRDIDPTGGDPFMGGPVAITVCDRCGRELEHSETAKEFNRQISLHRQVKAFDERQFHILRKKKWWERKRHCLCGWKGDEDYFFSHRESEGQNKAWSR